MSFSSCNCISSSIIKPFLKLNLFKSFHDINDFPIILYLLFISNGKKLIPSLSKYIKNKNDKEIVNVLKKLERFLFINFALRKVPSNYKDSQFYHLSQKLNKNEITLKNLCEYLEKIDDIDDKGNISLNEILPVFKKYFDKYEGFYSKSWKLYLKYFLYEYEISKVKNKKDTTIENPKDWFSDQSENTIEHIYPRDPEEKYGWIKDFEKYTDQQRHCFKNTLGNLLPLSKSVNSSLKNHSFAEKKKDISKVVNLNMKYL